MATTVDIWNLALARLGVASVATTTGPDRQSTLLRSIWDSVRRSFLASYPWNGALRVVSLVAGPTPAGGYSNSYALPASVLRVWEVNPDRDYQGTFDCKVEGINNYPGRFVLANVPECSIRASVDLDEAGIAGLSETTARALAFALAADAAIAFGKSSEEPLLRRLASEELGTARNVDATENPPQAFVDTTFIDVRF